MSRIEEMIRELPADTSTGPSTGLRTRLSTSLATVPIIILTARVVPGDWERCLEARANEYMSKPVSLKGLIKVIEVQLNRNRVEGEGLMWNTRALFSL